MTWVYFRTPEREEISHHAVWEWPGAEAELGYKQEAGVTCTEELCREQCPGAGGGEGL